MASNNDALVSIITPCFNCARYISQTIESVIAQTYTYWEMLIIDDCSNDNCMEIISYYAKKDRRIKLFKTDHNSGSPALPRNIGIKNAQGRYISFLDSDDIWLPDKLEKQMPLFNDANTAVVFSNYEKINEDGIRNGNIIKAPEEITYKKLLKSNYIGCLTGMYDAAKIGMMYFENYYHEDYVFWLSVLKKGYIARNANIPLALRRIRNDSLSAKKIIALKWQWNIYRNFLKLPFFVSLYYFCFYLINASIKYSK